MYSAFSAIIWQTEVVASSDFTTDLSLPRGWQAALASGTMRVAQCGGTLVTIQMLVHGVVTLNIIIIIIITTSNAMQCGNFVSHAMPPFVSLLQEW
jgi:hypothetical protein